MAVNVIALHKELIAAGVGISGVSTASVISTPESPHSWHTKNSTNIRLDWPAAPLPADLALADSVIAAHAGIGDVTPAMRDDIRTRWRGIAPFKGKTPAQIFTFMQGRIDGWASLADAKADLRQWLPLTVATLAWMVLSDIQTE